MNTDASTTTTTTSTKCWKTSRFQNNQNPTLPNPKNSQFSQSNNVAMFELKQKILTSISKLSDRDTHQIGVDDLECTIQALPSEALPMILNCLCEASSDPNTPTKRESIRLIALLCTSHRDSASAHLSKIVLSIVRRLRDSDSGVRHSCRDAVGRLSALYMNKECVSDSVLPLFSRALFEAMSEQNKGVQIGAALCICRFLEFASYIPVSGVQKLCMRTSKLLNSPNFLAKAALLPVVATLSKVEGISNQSMETLLQCTRDSIVSSDWATRKAAADALISLAPRSKALFTDRAIASTLSTLEDGRFDKIKPVRDSLVEAFQLWKKIAGKSDVLNVKISSDGCGNLKQFGVKEKKHTSDSYSDEEKKTPSEGIPDDASSDNSSSRNKSGGRISDKTAGILKKKAPSLTEKNLNPNFFQNLESRSSHDLPVEVVVPLGSKTQPSLAGTEPDTPNFIEKPGTPPPPEKAETAPDLIFENDSQSKPESYQRQLVLLESQQTHLLKMLQEFISTSNNGTAALEKRIRGLESTIEEIISDFSISSHKSGKFVSKSLRDDENRPSYSECYRNGSANGGRSRNGSSQFDQTGDSKQFRRGWDVGGGPRSGEGPSARSIWQAVKDEATLEAIRVAGEDCKYRHSRNYIHSRNEKVVEEGGGMVEDERVRGGWSSALSALQMGDLESAYSEILALGDPILLEKMMGRSGPVLDRLSNEIAGEVLYEVARFLKQQRFLYTSFSWIEQLIQLMEMEMERGGEGLEVSMEVKRCLLLGLLEAAESTPPHTTNQLFLHLSSAWGIHLHPPPP